MSMEANKALIRRWYHEMWNGWSEAVADEIVVPDVRFQGSLGVTVAGISGLREYMRRVREAFPDFHNEIEEMVADGERVAVRVTYTGTHRGEMYGIAPTGRAIRYGGAAFFTIVDGKVREGWVLGDVASLRRQLEEP